MAVTQFVEKFQKLADENKIGDADLLAFFGEYLDEEIVGGTTVRDLLMVTFLRIRNKAGRLVPFRPNRAQREIAARWGRRNIVLKARQLGMTTYVAARFFIDTVTRPGTLTVQVAHDQRSAEDIFRMVHRFQENLPEVLQQGALKTSRANTHQIVWPELDSEYRVETAADPNAGRGATIRNLHCSEVAAWTRDGREALAALRAAVPPDGQVVLESTPNGAGGLFYDEWCRSGETGYVPHFLPWWIEPGYRVRGVGVGELSDEERELVEKRGLDEEQIAFRRGIKAEQTRTAAQEYAESPEECFLFSGESVFEIEKVEQRLKECGGELGAGQGKEQVEFLPVFPGKTYIVGVDSASGGSDGDYSCAEVVDRETGLQCAELHGHFSLMEFANKVVALARKYNDAEIVAEKNGIGQSVIEHLKMSGYANLYGDKKDPGITTTATNRPAMIENLVNMMSVNRELFSSPRLLRECRTFVRQKDGGPRASAGSHDDTVMALAMALHVRKMCKPRREKASNGSALE